LNRKLYVGNLPRSANKQSLLEVFSKCGSVELIDVITDRATGENKGFAFIEMASPGEAQKAIQTLNGTMLDNREIKVNEARPPAPRNSHNNRSGGYVRR